MDTPVETPIKKNDIPIKFGIITGLAMVILLTVRYAFFSENFIMFWASVLLSNIFYIILFYIAANQQRKAFGGTISLQQAFSAIFIVILISVIISYIYNYIYFTYIDTGIIDRITNTGLAFAEEMGAPQEKLDEMAEQAAKQIADGTSIGKQLISLSQEMIGYSIFGIICAAIVKRKNPQQTA